MGERVIQAENLSRVYRVRVGQEIFFRRIISNQFREIRAVDRISFEVERGETVGFIGPNGAGKSTTIKMMTGILVPTDGSVKVLGKEPYRYRKDNAMKIGVVFGQRTQLWWDLPLSDTFRLLKSMYRIPDLVYKRNMELFMEELDLRAFFQQPVRQLSLGQRMRGEIAAAMLHDPEILFLDEPTIGLDVLVKQQLRGFIRSMNREKNVTMILTTHDMKDVEDLCQRIVLINGGKIVLDMPVSEVRDRFCQSHDVFITFAREPGMLACPDGCEIIPRGKLEYVFRVDHHKIRISDFIARYLAEYEVQDISIQGMEIEEIVRRLYQGRAAV